MFVGQGKMKPHPNFSILLASVLFSSAIAFSDYGSIVPAFFSDGKPMVEAAQGVCFQGQLVACQKDFAKAISSDVNIFKNPQLFTALLSGIYKKDINKGFLNLCNARNQYAKCLGDTYAVCTDLFNLFGKQGYSRTDAFILAGIYKNIDFDCGSGFTQAVEQWKCIVFVHGSETYKTESKKCFDTYNGTVDSDQTKFCPASQTYSLCLADIYNNRAVNACDHNDVMWWECERALLRSKLEGFCDTITCQNLFKKSEKSEFDSIIEFGNRIIPQARQDMFKKARFFGRHNVQVDN